LLYFCKYGQYGKPAARFHCYKIAQHSGECDWDHPNKQSSKYLRTGTLSTIRHSFHGLENRAAQSFGQDHGKHHGLLWKIGIIATSWKPRSLQDNRQDFPKISQSLGRRCDLINWVWYQNYVEMGEYLKNVSSCRGFNRLFLGSIFSSLSRLARTASSSSAFTLGLALTFSSHSLSPVLDDVLVLPLLVLSKWDESYFQVRGTTSSVSPRYSERNFLPSLLMK